MGAAMRDPNTRASSAKGGMSRSAVAPKMIDIEKVHALAERLIRDGHVNDEPDARLMAIRILLAKDRARPTTRPTRRPTRRASEDDD